MYKWSTWTVCLEALGYGNILTILLNAEGFQQSVDITSLLFDCNIQFSYKNTAIRWSKDVASLVLDPHPHLAFKLCDSITNIRIVF